VRRDAAPQLLSDLLEESEEAAPGWVATLLAALVPPAPAERMRVAAAVLQRAEAQVAPAAQVRAARLLPWRACLLRSCVHNGR
jgi:hypothetical protein